MKKLYFTVLIGALSVFSMSGQEHVKLAASGGIPLGDAGDYSKFSVVIDFSYQLEISDTFTTGIATGYSQTITKHVGGIKADNVKYIPVSGTMRFHIGRSFTLGADLGYAFGLNENNDGFYYAPRAQFKIVNGLDIVAAYRGTITTRATDFSIATLGLELEL